MTVFINLNESETNAIDPSALKKAIQITLEFLNTPDVDVTLKLTDDHEMRQLNHAYRGIDRTTDVLAFNQNYVDPQSQQLYLGDIVISVETAKTQAKENNHSLLEECALLSIHGTLHLLGYDHDGAKEKAAMWEKQETLLKTFMKEIQEDAG